MENDLWRRAEEIFNEVLELPRETRPAFLDKACGENAALRRQVERLLATDEQAVSLLEKPALAGAMAEETPMIGRILDHYRITSQIGKSGMGEVYRAKDHSLHNTFDRKPGQGLTGEPIGKTAVYSACRLLLGSLPRKVIWNTAIIYWKSRVFYTNWEIGMRVSRSSFNSGSACSENSGLSPSYGP